jgi:quercetin dioxygenase-like cupin family protein
MSLPVASESVLPPNTLRTPTTHISTHDPVTKTSKLHSSVPAQLCSSPLDANMNFATLYSSANPASFTDDADIAAHEALAATPFKDLVKTGGTVIRYVDFAPGYECVMHRTKSLDFGILVEGEIVSVLEDGTQIKMQRGDVWVQRGTMHAWRNEGEGWARMAFVLLDSEEVVVGGEVLEPRFMSPEELAEVKKGWARKE